METNTQAINGIPIEMVSEFAYISSTITTKGGVESDIRKKI